MIRIIKNITRYLKVELKLFIIKTNIYTGVLFKNTTKSPTTY